jgi:hypothetical protein
MRLVVVEGLLLTITYLLIATVSVSHVTSAQDRTDGRVALQKITVGKSRHSGAGARVLCNF